MTGGLYQGRRNPLDSHDPTPPPAEEQHYLDLRLVGFLSSRSAGGMRSGDGGDSASGGAPRVGGARWRKWRIRTMLHNHHKKRQTLDLKSGWGPNG